MRRSRVRFSPVAPPTQSNGERRYVAQSISRVSGGEGNGGSPPDGMRDAGARARQRSTPQVTGPPRSGGRPQEPGQHLTQRDLRRTGRRTYRRCSDHRRWPSNGLLHVNHPLRTIFGARRATGVANPALTVACTTSSTGLYASGASSPRLRSEPCFK
jgi:hypothetical protein